MNVFQRGKKLDNNGNKEAHDNDLSLNGNEAGTGNQYRFDVFISYRHADLDQYVAENIHFMLENFKLPKNINKPLRRKKIERVFRDNDELEITNNLEESLVQALRDSEYLIVICSPRILESKWCRKEIETFKKFHGSKNVFPVLIEGSTKESFPKELLWDNGKIIEPFAADVRGGKKAFKKKIKNELLRIVAPMFGLSYDDLKQRRHEATLKRRLRVSFSITVVTIILNTIFALAALTIYKQNKYISTEQAKATAKLAIEQMNNDEFVEGRKLAFMSVTEKDGIKMPYTAEGHQALFQALCLYGTSGTYIPCGNIRMAGLIKKIDVSPNGEEIVIVDNVGNVEIWDAVHLKKLFERGDMFKSGETYEVGINDNRVGFFDDNNIFFISSDDILSIYNIKSKKQVKTFDNVCDCTEAYAIDKRYIVLLGYDADDFWNKKIFLFDNQENKLIYKEKFENFSLSNFTDCGDYISYVEYIDNDDDQLQVDRIKVSVINKSNGKAQRLINFNASYVKDIELDENGNIYAYYAVINDYMNINENEYYIAKFSIDGRLIWKQQMSEKYSKVEVDESNDFILMYGEKNVICIDKKSGEIQYYGEGTTDFVDIFDIDSENSEWLVTTDGCIYECIKNDSGVFVCDDLWNLGLSIHCKNIKYLKLVNKIMYVIPSTEEQIVIYQPINNNDKKLYSGEIYSPKVKMFEGGYNLSKDEAVTEAKRLGIKNYEHIDCIIECDDTGEIYAENSNKEIIIYDAKTLEEKGKFKIDGKLSEYAGEDIYGNKYFVEQFYQRCYCVNSKYEVIEVFDMFIGLNLKRDKVIIYDAIMMNDNSVGVAYPIYTIDELKKKAEEQYNF